MAKAFGRQENKQGVSALMKFIGVRQTRVPGANVAYNLIKEQVKEIKRLLKKMHKVLKQKHPKVV